MKTRANRLVSMLLAGALCLSLLAACAPKKKELTRYSTIFYDVFDTVTQVIAYCESEEVFKTQMDALHADLVTYLFLRTGKGALDHIHECRFVFPMIVLAALAETQGRRDHRIHIFPGRQLVEPERTPPMRLSMMFRSSSSFR